MENIKESVHKDFVQLRANKKEYFDTFYKNNYDLVYKICLSLLKDSYTSEDIAQTVFEKLLKMDVSQFPTEYESSWLYTVSKNEVLQHLRRKKITDGEDALENVSNDDNGINDVLENDNYNKIMKKLNKKQEQIVSLKVMSDFTFKEIGQIMSMPTATVQWYYYSSLKYLKVAMANFVMFIVALIAGSQYIRHNEEINNINRSESTKEAGETNNAPMDSASEVQEAPLKSSQRQPADIYNVETIQSVGAEDSIPSNYNNVKYAGIIGITVIFLILTIIFSIFFIKYQQKGSKKASKK